MATSQQSGLPAGIAAPVPGVAEGEAAADVRARGYWEQVWRRFRHDRVAVGSGIAIILLVLAAFIGAPIAESLLGHGPNDLIKGGAPNFVPADPWSHVSTGKGDET